MEWRARLLYVSLERLFTDRAVFEKVDLPTSYVKIKPEIGDPIQLSDLHPVACESLVRMGNANDGGYVVPLDAVRAARALVSFGLSHNWTFEHDFKQSNPDAIIHCYDHTVSLLTAFQFSIGQLLRFVLLLRTSALRKTFTWLDYKLFFRSNATHFKQRIGPDSHNSVTIDDVFNRLPADCPVFVKMDIEGSEYLVVDDLLQHSISIVAMAIEFHDIDTQPDLFNSLVEKIKRDFHIVHIHANNMGGIAPFKFPNAPEITFLNKRFLDSAPQPSRLKYPVPGLDSPNHPELPDFLFEF